MIVRDIITGTGCITVPDDTIHINAVSTGAANSYQGFKVTSPAAGAMWPVSTSQTVTWNVVGTNAAPVSCDSVDIYISPNGGTTWATYVGRFVNTGSATFTVPSSTISSATERIKVKGAGNVFFNVNGGNFTISGGPTAVQNMPAFSAALSVFPIPARDVVHFTYSETAPVHMTIVNSVGQVVWSGEMSGRLDLTTAGWARGIYYARFIDAIKGGLAIKPIILD